MFSTSIFTDDEIKVYNNGIELINKPYKVHGKSMFFDSTDSIIMLPARKLFEKLGYKVECITEKSS